jgi:hypothetical protein
MVLVIHGTRGAVPKGRQIGGGRGRLRIINTSSLTRDAPVIQRIRR